MDSIVNWSTRERDTRATDERLAIDGTHASSYRLLSLRPLQSFDDSKRSEIWLLLAFICEIEGSHGSRACIDHQTERRTGRGRLFSAASGDRTCLACGFGPTTSRYVRLGGHSDDIDPRQIYVSLNSPFEARSHPGRNRAWVAAIAARASPSADAVELGELVLGEGERGAFDVLAQVRDG
jgi:hypothetical protein